VPNYGAANEGPEGVYFECSRGLSLLTLLQLPEILTKLREFQQKNHLEVDKFRYVFCSGGQEFFFGNTNRPFMVDVVGLLLGDGLAEEPPGRCLCCFSAKIEPALVEIL